ncbi:hypothetical protein SLH49_00185 [Cognatiyoonia sp. IB215446]|uniref:hypothetical protein n=1 Tax=Cognatiyoonia sp. IB215446 TaxID=3097355 RepID=UPI002A120228|nr:hypothetical protein [Cognatiyoonia sp. IB215446]MDX8346392.1 hypothetical protein [Cognatiyoonia sp. IB215446]
MTSALDYDLDERRAIKLLEGIRGEISLEIYQSSLALIANGEWELALSRALHFALEDGPLNDLTAITAILPIMRSTGADTDRTLLELLKKSRAVSK